MVATLMSQPGSTWVKNSGRLEALRVDTVKVCPQSLDPAALGAPAGEEPAHQRSPTERVKNSMKSPAERQTPAKA